MPIHSKHFNLTPPELLSLEYIFPTSSTPEEALPRDAYLPSNMPLPEPEHMLPVAVYTWSDYLHHCPSNDSDN